MLINYQEVKEITRLCSNFNRQTSILILDEPTTSMDIETREHFWNLIEQLKEDGITTLHLSLY